MKLLKPFLFLLLLAPVGAAATTTFSYQGQLNDGTEPFDGTVDMEFRLFDAGSGGNQVGTTIAGPVALHVHEDTGVTIGGFFLAPPAGLMVHGDVQQERTSYGIAKAAADVWCGVVQTSRVRCRIRDLSGSEISARINLVVF